MNKDLIRDAGEKKREREKEWPEESGLFEEVISEETPNSTVERAMPNA
jgi:hypothetical protein